MMTYDEFDTRLKSVNLSKKEFADITQMSYTSVTNWKQTDNIPGWVESWLQNYIKSAKFDKAKKIFDDEFSAN